jgi:hypothetical protein
MNRKGSQSANAALEKDALQRSAAREAAKLLEERLSPAEFRKFANLLQVASFRFRLAVDDLLIKSMNSPEDA